MIYSYSAVERIPKSLSNGVVYHNEGFQLAAMLCACGCGHRVDLLVPDSHKISSENGLATIRPSIAVCDAPCKSHYYITAGRVEWMTAFTHAQATAVMRDQVARHAARDSRRRSWSDRSWSTLVRVFKQAKAFFGL